MQIDTGILDDGDPCGMLVGERIALDSTLPALRPCRWCGHERGVKTGPKGPHHDGVRCEKCHSHIGWLPPPASDFELIEH